MSKRARSNFVAANAGSQDRQLVVQRLVRRIRWGKVRSSKNSYSTTAKLSQLDWGEWWADGGLLVPGTYLHVPRREDDTFHRVFCRHSDKARLGWRSGELWWVYSPNGALSNGGGL